MDLNSYEFIQNPYDTYNTLNKTARVFHHPDNDFYYVSGYDLVKEIFTHNSASSNRVKQLTKNLPNEVLKQIEPLTSNFSKWLIFNDPPYHTPIRKVINSSLTVNIVENLIPSINTLADELLESAGTEFDVIRDFAYPLPILIISRMLGVPAEDQPMIKQWSDEVAQFLGDRTTPQQVFTLQNSIIAASEYFAELIKSQRANPTSLIIQNMFNFQEQEKEFTDEHLIANAIGLIFAGHETTTNAIGNAILTLINHQNELPDADELLASIDTTLNECLRFESPVQRMGRYSTDDITVGDTTIPKGKRILLLIGAANRDPHVFDEPNRFIFNRTSNRHIAFGFGTHLCSGANLARTELKIALVKFLKKYPLKQIKIDSFKWKQNLGLRALEYLNINH